MPAEIVCIGEELLRGETVNTNATYLSRKLAGLGIEVLYVTTVGDHRSRILTTLKQAMHRSDIVIATGGLGPTVDDLTLEVVSQATERKLIFHPPLLKEIQAHFQRRHIPMPKENIRQALIPQGALPLKNEVGTAPGLIIPFAKKVLIALPGVPAEMQPMVERDVLPYLAKNFAAEGIIVTRTIRTTGLAESQVNQKVKDILSQKFPLSAGIYVHTECVDLRITARAKDERQAQSLLKPIEAKIHARLKEYIYGYNSQTLEEVLAQLLTHRKKTVAVAESCTGGLISRRLTNISGSSRYFLLGLVAYSNRMKQTLLQVAPETLEKYGAVSRQTARAMAKNIRELANTDLGLGVTGIAGPGGATKEKPRGLVYIALATKGKTRCQEFHFHGDREAVRLRASQAALDMLRRYLL